MTASPAQFSDLVQSRRTWIDTELRPWCQQASRRELLKAHDEWIDIAGKADPDATLWTWAWERFPALACDGLTGVNETSEVQVELRDGSSVSGFPEGRRSLRGELFLVQPSSGGGTTEHGPYSIDDIASVAAVGANPAS